MDTGEGVEMEKIGESASVLMVKDMGAYENFEEKC